ncbi:UDP-N-acetylmuramoyl-L-alanyl-D-glutamate--2,6-diaminopimelate ligase [Listeria monocytogenes]|nr:UDP-N-acetylmuramoyl-L-alanyl-D-glutamate--2,6-diaminopimelate ligase [Listeria monocytogenes]EAD1242053.1 UDP-N-acetylmuramoyl-L-alanyl-D-glutamate--2,6-diaminopimelate ligase [Listeria monocytogenes]EAF6809515.1 UDP-N-acetylmuramoyl-L-alanyl-D-glutamate--2,6-diaminopimelate ligase [Listeria monocytogenes]EIN8475888.1 UDP-N-acetylmuramoyl-L-alanyl-D-glutamate--2,6-diaminopimelate ligase [Listeria monocytogenes]EJI4983315.1 UDP-N-acetylmuramoyl-L-alanyl-D-glutamate--2,6-diaminopimelate ligas
MKLNELMEAIPVFTGEVSETIEISHIAQDSRKVKPGTLFICIDGEVVDGHQFASRAVELGAVAIIAEKQVDVSIPVIYVRDSKRAMAMLADYFYGSPTQALKLVGITGTNGKTTVSHLVEQIVRENGEQTGLIGTMYRKIGDQILETKNTTPDSLTLQETFRDMLLSGVSTAVMEVSSHALVQGRVYGSDYDVAVFMNLSQDHLDYHHTMEEYANAKSLLFAQLGNSYHTSNPKIAVLNADDAESVRMQKATAAHIITFGIKQEADFQASNIKITSHGSTFDLGTPVGNFTLKIKMIGNFSVYNVLAAIATSFALHIPMEKAIKTVESIPGVKGRFELVHAGQEFPVIVDYAHTPDGLLNVLETIDEFAEKRVFVVVGCGGDRDKGKRPQMAKIAVDYATNPIFTSDNPRSENPRAIIEDMIQGVPESDAYVVHENRRDAIRFAVNQAEAGDVILIAGKGHEDYQVVGDEVIDFDDRVEARIAIEKKLGLA